MSQTYASKDYMKNDALKKKRTRARDTGSSGAGSKLSSLAPYLVALLGGLCATSARALYGTSEGALIVLTIAVVTLVSIVKR